jgi:glycosyltransferase involved in cell wall biosynthesis
MRFLFVHSGADLYGASRSLLRLSRRLLMDGHPVTAVLPYEGPLTDELRDSGIRVIIHKDLPIITRQRYRRFSEMITLIIGLITSTIRLTRLIRELKPDIVHSNTAVILSAGLAAKLTRKPHIWHVRESFVEFRGFWKIYQKYMNALADLIICVSSPIAQQFNAHILKDKIQVVHNGFPKDEFISTSPNRVNEFRQKYGIADHLVVGVVGRIKFQRKGQDVFVKAAHLLSDRYSNVKYMCIGSPFPGNEDHLHRLLCLIEELCLTDQFVYTGDVDDIKAAYAALDISVLPSVQPEPFGGVVIESMAMGKPVIGTKIGGTIEQIEDGKTGFLVEPGDPQALARAIEILISDEKLRHQFGENGRRRFLDLFEFERYYERMMKIYAVYAEHKTV